MVPHFIRQSFNACKIFNARKSQYDPVKQLHFGSSHEDADKAAVDPKEEERHGDEDNGKVIENAVDGSVGAVVLGKPEWKALINLIPHDGLRNLDAMYNKSFLC